MMERVAVLITCHNRREKTLSCLKALFANEPPDDITLHVILVDDGSTDGTSEAVVTHYPAVEIIRGNGDLYWNGGMWVAFDAALKKGYDYYLWLNDDTTLYTTAISALLETQQAMKTATGRYGIAVGSTCDDSGKLTYGGKQQLHKLRPFNFSTVQPTNFAISCATMNGNCVLVSAKAATQLGNLDSHFVHAIGDIDYGLRARDAGLPVWVMAGFAGRCAHDHTLQGSFLDEEIPLRSRLKKIISPKNLPVHSWWIFCRRHAGWLWPLQFIWPYMKAVFFPKQAV